MLCLGAVGPCAGFHTGVLPALRSSGTALVPARSARATTPALSRLSMAFDADAIAAAAERGKQREKVIEEKRKAREAKERAARDVEREKDRQLVMGGGAAFVAGKGLVNAGGKFVAANEVGFSGGLNKEAVKANLEIIAAGGSPNVPNKVFKSLKKNSGQMAVALGYQRAAEDTEDINHVDFRRYSVKLRESKLDVLLVDTTTPIGWDDCHSFVQEQASAKGGFPGPVPIIASTATTPDHIAEAKALGCQGVMVSYAGGKGDELVKGALSLALEPIALVATEAEVAAAVAAGAKILCTAPASADVGPGEAAAAAQALRAKIPMHLVAVAGLDSHIGGPPTEVFSPEVELAAIEMGMVKDKDAHSNFSQKVLNYAAALKTVESDMGGFSAIVAMKAVQSSGLRVERNYGTWMLEKLLSKKSTSFNIGEGTLGLS